MNKIPDNANATRLIRLFNRNLGTDFTQINKAADQEHLIDPKDVAKKRIIETDSHHISNTNKHQTLAMQNGIAASQTYNLTKLNINQRALRRRQLEEARKQHNIETIMGLAMEYCSEGTATSDDIDPDWFHQFLQQAEQISSPLMQKLWGKILAGEVSRPGTFSFKSLTTLKRMTNKEAIAFQHAGQLAMTNRRDNSSQIIYGYYQKPGILNFFQPDLKQHINLSKLSLPYPELLMLMDIELIYHSEIESGALNKQETIEFAYLGGPVRFTAKRNNTVLNYFKFTQTGSELLRLIRLTPAQSYLDELRSVFNSTFDISG